MTDQVTPPVTPPVTTPETPPAPAAWHTGIAPETIGFWQTKGWFDPANPDAKKVAEGLTKSYREVERFVGAPPDEMIRVPKPNAATADIDAYWQRIGVPKESKDYDLSSVKRADGKDVDTALVDAFRAAVHSSRVTKDQAAPILAAVIKQLDAADAASLAERTASIKAEREALDKNWGTNKAYNTAVAERALRDLATAAGVPAEQIKAAADALSTVGGIGASKVWEMFRIIGSKMGEAPFIGKDNPGGGDKVMSREQAKAEIETLKADRAFYKQLVVDKSVEAKRRWDDLHKIAFAA